MGRRAKDRRKLQTAISGILDPREPRHRNSRHAQYLKRWWRIRALSKALGKALEDSRRASSWPGERLPVSFDIAEQVELSTQRLQLEIEAHGRKRQGRRINRSPRDGTVSLTIVC